ncbi:MAG TPA: hypothetical protein VF116_11000 [Ktedonobacterales bacterium]
MIWLTWRQHRIEASIVLGALALLAALMVVTGIDMRTSYQQLNIATCLNQLEPSQNCMDALRAFRDQYSPWVNASEWLNLIPALLGILIGAPLVARELEHGTQRLVWTQSVTRWRWLAVKLLLVLGGCLVVAAALALLLSWWRQPWDTLEGRFSAGFDFEGPVLGGYVLFALALAIAAGALLRKAIPAMVVTLAAFLAVRVPVEFHFRGYYQPPLAVTFDPAGTAAAGLQLSNADWQVNSYFVDHVGHQIADQQVYSTCLNSFASTKPSFLQCVHAHGWLFAELYQPANRYWTFQAIETALFVALALGLLALTVYWVRSRLS